MDGLSGTIKNVVFRQVKSRKLVINLPIEFCDAANKFIPHDIENAPVISNTSQIHCLVIGNIGEDGKTTISLSDCKGTQTHNHLIRKRTLNHLAKLAK